MKTNDKTKISLPQGIVDETGRHIIRGILSTHAPDATCLPATWNWAARVGGFGEYVGTLPKRIAKFYWQKSKMKLSSDLLGKIGSVIGLHTSKAEAYTFDITDSFDWEAGDFGDDGSCYWSCHAGARPAMKKHGCTAIRFYDENGGGMGRAWLCDTEDGVVLFNSHGLDAPLAARILATYRGLSYRKVDLENNGKTNGLIWINCDGYLIGPEELVNNHGLIDLCIGEGQHCYGCGEYIDGDFITLHDGGHVCSDCEDDYGYCADCDQWFHCDELTHIGDNCVCENCLCSYTFCDDCEEWHSESDCEHIGVKYICSDCLTQGDYIECKTCDTWVALDDSLDVDEEWYCHSCAEDLDYSVCEECGLACTDCVDQDGETFCKDCAERRCVSCHRMTWTASQRETIRGKVYCENCAEEANDEEYPLLATA
jgi:hypothetical protein